WKSSTHKTYHSHKQKTHTYYIARLFERECNLSLTILRPTKVYGIVCFHVLNNKNMCLLHLFFVNGAVWRRVFSEFGGWEN
ncbi:MAG: hypothetical protein KIH08_02290, partial [Candidatus Freyarchaeota archaeon]|nr:hypothetical protein [Candidatus Jordarchaeia archaeon]